MAINFPGPFEIRIQHTSPDLTPGGRLVHVTRLNIDLDIDGGQGEEFGDHVVLTKSGSIALDVLVEDFLEELKEIYNTGHSFDSVELWKYPTAQSFDSVFWGAYEPVIGAGVNAGPDLPATQLVFTFRTQEGGIMKFNAIENGTTPGLPVTYVNLSANQKAIVDFILEGGATYSAPFIARDTSYPIAFIRMFPGQNEALFKKRYRP